MIGALLYLRITSLWNLVAYRLRRLRQPKYLFGAAVAAAYLYFILFRRSMTAGQVASMPGMASAGTVAAAFICAGASALALLRITYAWIAPAEKPGLRFSEPEIAFLFPAPISRRMLINFRLLSAQVAIMFTSVLIMFFFRRFGNPGGSRLMHAAGWWIILSTFDLHLNGTNLTVSRLKEKGGGNFLLIRAAVVAAIILYVAAVVWSAVAFVDAHSPGGLSSEMDGVLHGLMEYAPLRWFLLPFRIVFAPYFATDLRAFGLAMVPALALLALHYYWVSSTEARFEEGSIALAEKRAAIKSALARGEAPRLGAAKPKAVRGPFPLSPSGPPEVAFLWKNLLSMRSSLVNRRTVMLSIWILLCVSFALKPILAEKANANGSDVYRPIIVMFCGIFAAYTLLVGPQIARQDLRNDIPNVDILKTYPMEGWRLALGELLAPTLLLTLILWVCIVVSTVVVDPHGTVDWLTPAVRVAAVVCLGTAAPVLCFILLLVPNTIMVLMPSWYQAVRSRGGGIELMGQRMILGLGQLLIALVVGAPAAGAAVLIIFSAHWVIGVAPSIFLATLAVLVIMGSEAVVGLWWLGERFERLDLSTEMR